MLATVGSMGLPPHRPPTPMIASTLPVHCQNRQWLPTLGNFFKLFKKVAKRCRGGQHCITGSAQKKEPAASPLNFNLYAALLLRHVEKKG